jgi:ribosomal protein S18 acetylase RimI-like enzyme
MVILRDFIENDAEKCTRIANQSFQDEINRGMPVFMAEYFTQRQKWKNHKLVVADEVDVIGFMLMTNANSFVPAQLHLVAVDSSFRRYGIGKRLVEYAIKYTVENGWVKLMLFARPWNLAMRGLCEGLGFVEEGLLKKEHLGEDLIQYSYLPNVAIN